LKGIWYAVRSVYWSNSDHKTFDQYTDRTRIKFFDRILTSNPINKISNVWSGFGSALKLPLIELQQPFYPRVVTSCNAVLPFALLLLLVWRH
jgi:hypothetical protein